MIYDKNNVNNSILSITRSIRNNISKNRNTLNSLVALANNTNGIISTLVNQIKGLNNQINKTANAIKDKTTIENCKFYNSQKLDDYIEKAKTAIENIKIPQNVSDYCNEKYGETIDEEEVKKKQQKSNSKDLDGWIEEQEQEQEQEELTFDKMTEKQRREQEVQRREQEQEEQDLPIGSCGIFGSKDIKGTCMSGFDVTDGGCNVYIGADKDICTRNFTFDEAPVNFSCIKYKTEEGYVQQYEVDEETGQIIQLGLNQNTDSPVKKKCSLYGSKGEEESCYNGYNDPNGYSPSCKKSYIINEDKAECVSYAAIDIDENGDFIIVACSSWNTNGEMDSCLTFINDEGLRCTSYSNDSSTTSCDNFVAPKTDINCFTYNKTDNQTQCVEFGQDNTTCGTYTINVENNAASCKLFTDPNGTTCNNYMKEDNSTITIDEEGNMVITGGSCQCYGSDGNYNTSNYDKETGVRTDRSDHTDEHGVKTTTTTTTDASGETTTTTKKEPGYVSSGNNGTDSEEWQEMQEDYWENHEGELE